jgi:malonate transporter
VALVGKSVRGDVADIAWTSFGKLIFHPALIALACFILVDDFRQPIVLASVLLAASPMPSMYSIFGMKYGFPAVTTSSLTMATFLSLFTISGWILILGI